MDLEFLFSWDRVSERDNLTAMASASVEWVIGGSGRPIRVGGKAHKKMLKMAKLAGVESALSPTMSISGTGRVPPSKVQVAVPKKPTLKREETLVNGVEPPIKKKKISKRKTENIMEETKDADGSGMEEDSESSEDDDEEPTKGSKGEIQAIVEKFLGKHEQDLCRAYEFYGEGPKFVAHMNELMEKELL